MKTTKHRSRRYRIVMRRTYRGLPLAMTLRVAANNAREARKTATTVFAAAHAGLPPTNVRIQPR